MTLLLVVVCVFIIVGIVTQLVGRCSDGAVMAQ